MHIIDGNAVAATVNEELQREIGLLPQKPTLGIISVGHNPASQRYIQRKMKAAELLNIKVTYFPLPEQTTEAALISLVEKCNHDSSITGFIVQLPLPFSAEKIVAHLNPEKDLDGVHPLNRGKLSAAEPELVPATAAGIMKLLEAYHIPLAGRHAVVIGRSNIVGKPIAALLLQQNATVTVTHSYTQDIAQYTTQADILIAAAGKPKLITPEMVKPGAVVIDVGTTIIDGKLIGDVDFERVKRKASFISPVPGGVGPMTVAMLLHNLVVVAKKNIKDKKDPSSALL